MEAPIETVRWRDGAVRIIDQRFLPRELVWRDCREVEDLALAIETLAVRGAPAIGVAAAYGVALGALRAHERGADPAAGARAAAERLRRTRPTAVNLFYALDRMLAAVAAASGAPPPADTPQLADTLRLEADAILAEDLDTGRRIGAHGLAVLPDTERVVVLTHCNAGGLATGGWGTALAPIYAAARAGRSVLVYADETRPLLQGARLTAWELARVGIEVKILVDGAAASVLAREKVDMVIVGADRVARNGDTANKIGTFSVALGAAHAKVPFYVAAPLSTFDFAIASGAEIPVEERSAAEVLGEHPAEGASAVNPAFDVTPAALIAGWITEVGILHPPFDPALATRTKN
jgi:methylthioribose-1-phosphate isomerase